MLYILALITGIVSIPLMVAGPTLLGEWLPDRADFLLRFYWPVVGVICICFLATLYHLSVPVRTSWRFNLPGAVFSLLAWVLGSYLLRWVLTVTAADSRSIYGPLAAPIADPPVALPGRDRRADRGRGQRRLRHRVPAEEHDARPKRHPAAPRAAGG